MAPDLSDVLNQPITLPDNSEGAAFGAAVLGFISSGKLKSIADTATWSTPRRCIRLWKKNVAVYQQLYDIFVRLYHNLQREFATSRHISRIIISSEKERLLWHFTILASSAWRHGQ